MKAWYVWSLSLLPVSGALAQQMLPEVLVTGKASELEERRATVQPHHLQEEAESALAATA